MNELLEPPPDEPPSQPVRALNQPAGHPARPAEPEIHLTDFTAFYRAEVPHLVAFLLWLGARLTDAADLAQETMIDAYASWPTVRHPRAWTRRVASRKYGRRIANAEEPVDHTDGTPLLPPHHDAANWEQQHEILRLLGGLPWRQRQVMAWTFDGYAPQEIASELGITPEAVRSSLKLARRALAAVLNQAGDDPQ
jgi:RNA polymerase sigma factor (sigma-70 family)